MCLSVYVFASVGGVCVCVCVQCMRICHTKLSSKEMDDDVLAHFFRSNQRG